jgi:hypothetical protein
MINNIFIFYKIDIDKKYFKKLCGLKDKQN